MPSWSEAYTLQDFIRAGNMAMDRDSASYSRGHCGASTFKGLVPCHVRASLTIEAFRATPP